MKIDEARRRAFIRKLLAWGRRNGRPLPWRDQPDPFRVLVTEVLLQRSRGTTFARIYNELFERFPDANAMAMADPEEIAAIIRPLGLVRRAHTLKRLAVEVVERGGVPGSVEEMLRLFGVGRYSASATAAGAFGQPVAAVDATSARVYRRVFGLPGPKDSHVDEELWKLAASVTPRSRAQEWNWAVLDLAAAICLPKLPRCHLCPVNKECLRASEALVSVASPG